MKLESLRDLYISELKDLYNAEQQLVKALPKMADAANSPDLRAALSGHLEQTRYHVTRLEEIFRKLDESPKGQKCRGMEGLIEEGEEMMDEGENAPPPVSDAALISSAQRVEHYEMAGYGTCRTYARRLGLEDHADLLQQTLQEEEAADRRLTELAEASIPRTG